MKKSVLVVFTGAMELGGIERSLLGLLDSFDYEKYDVDLFLYGHHGALFPLINSNVNILPEVKELAYLRESFVTKLKHGCWYSACLRLRDQIAGLGHYISHDRSWLQVVRKFAPKLDKRYDLAISFFKPFDFIFEKVSASIKIGWVHTDYSKTGHTPDELREEYSRMDYIAAVSDDCARVFSQLVPELRDKVIVVQNILSSSQIRQEASKMSVIAEMPDDGYIKLLSVGRFCDPKNFDSVPEICKNIIQNGEKVKWYLIGFGPDEQLIRDRIEESGMQDYVIILGKKNNPYPYIKACDIYVQPSRYEGKCVAVTEAQILCKPVIITNYPTANCQLENGIDGIIVPLTIEECADGIVSLIKNKEKQYNLSQTCSARDYQNKEEIKKLYQLIQ